MREERTESTAEVRRHDAPERAAAPPQHRVAALSHAVGNRAVVAMLSREPYKGPSKSLHKIEMEEISKWLDDYNDIPGDEDDDAAFEFAALTHDLLALGRAVSLSSGRDYSDAKKTREPMDLFLGLIDKAAAMRVLAPGKGTADLKEYQDELEARLQSMAIASTRMKVRKDILDPLPAGSTTQTTHKAKPKEYASSIAVHLLTIGTGWPVILTANEISVKIANAAFLEAFDVWQASQQYRTQLTQMRLDIATLKTLAGVDKAANAVEARLDSIVSRRKIEPRDFAMADTWKAAAKKRKWQWLSGRAMGSSFVPDKKPKPAKAAKRRKAMEAQEVKKLNIRSGQRVGDAAATATTDSTA